METKNRIKCEIWTRVMGYHRPVSQYNFGKKSEFYSRIYFNPTQEANEKLEKQYGSPGKTTEISGAVKYLLFTTTTCPKCPAVKNLLNELQISYFSIDNTMLNFHELAEKYQVRSVPTVIGIGHSDEEIWRTSELAEIKRHLC
ncbi:hypothetical protein IT411_01445 [Candidatus Peregrinibacteria bacterium]|nr:hypothetical protein [Candidatus Peregrinibacteria bacterium]